MDLKQLVRLARKIAFGVPLRIYPVEPAKRLYVVVPDYNHFMVWRQRHGYTRQDEAERRVNWVYREDQLRGYGPGEPKIEIVVIFSDNPRLLDDIRLLEHEGVKVTWE